MMQVNWFSCEDGSWSCLEKDVAKELENGYVAHMKGEVTEPLQFKIPSEPKGVYDKQGYVDFSKMVVYSEGDGRHYFKLRRIVEA